MSCIHNDFFEGKCALFSPLIECLGHDENGVCICDNDPDPSELCENFEEC